MNNQSEQAIYRVLVVDDNPSIHDDFRKILCPQLSQSGAAVARMVTELFGDTSPAIPKGRFEMDSASQGKDAVEKARQAELEGRPYSVAFVDVRMPPGWDGIETVARMWEATPDLQVVICTAYSDYSQQQMVERLGLTDSLLILKKPFDNIEVLQLAHTLTQKWQLSRALRDRMRSLEEMVDTRTRELKEANTKLQQEMVEKIKAEELLLREKAFTRQIIDTSANLIFVKDGEGRFVMVNQAMARLFNTEPDLMLGRYDAEFLSVPSEIEQYAKVERQVISSGKPITLEEAHVRPDGSTVWFLTTKVPLHTSAGTTLVLGLSADITERKQIEDGRLILNKLESTGILAGGIAHDFNNLLASILLNVDLARSHPTSGEGLYAYLEAVRSGAVTAHRLTKQLITFSKGGLPIRKLADISELVRGSVGVALSGSTVRSVISLPDSPYLVEVDEGQLGQVIRNLVLNARDAMPAGGVVSVRLDNVTLPADDSPALPPGAYVKGTVSDTGLGIQPEALPKIFDPYFSTKQRGTDKGMGLGLTICHSVIQKHGGAITVKSKPGEGTTFSFWLPASQKSLTQTSPKQPAPVLPRRKILVMDDEECMRTALALVIQEKGHEVILAKHGKEAIELFAAAKAQESPFDTVILDLTVRDGMGGTETIREILKLDPEAKAIVMSGYAEDPVLLNPRLFGFKAGIVKSFDVDQLTEMLSLISGRL